MKKLSIYTLVACLLALLVMMPSCRKDKEIQQRPPAVSSYYPNSGKAGTLVTLLGTGLNREGKVWFGETVAEILNQNDTSMVVRAPEGGQTGSIIFDMDGERIEAGNYTYQALTVRTFTPANGAAGTHIRISGEGFSSLESPVVVLINGVTATVVSASDTLVVAEIPENAGTGPVTVTVDGKHSTGANFRFQAISSIKPLTGGAGTKVRINGSGFETLAAGNSVDFNGKPAVVAEAAADHLIVIAPQGVSTGPVAVTINGQKTAGPAFTVVPFPTLETVSPLSGPAGTLMTITGLYFSKEVDENIVKINGTVLPVKTAAGNKLTLVLPGGTGNGKVQVIVNDQLVEGPEFRDQHLGISELSPANGLAGTKVTITGTGFSTVAAENMVTFNGAAAVVESATATSLVVVAPASLTSGPVKVKRAAAEALSPVEFLRAGVITLFGGPTSDIISPSMSSIVADSKGNVYMSDRNAGKVWKITPGGSVTLYGGSPTGILGRKDGPVADALFSTIMGMAIDQQDNIYLTEYGNGNSIRKISAAGNVTTYYTNLNSLVKIGVDKNNDVYVTQSYQGILKIYPNGSTERKYAFTAADICRPVIDAAGNIYFVPDEYEAFIGMAPATGTGIRRWLGSTIGYQDGPKEAALFSYGISGMLLDKAGNLIILDKVNYAIRKYNFVSGEVSTVAKLSAGYADGSFQDAKIGFNVADMAIDGEGNLYLLDINNKAVRKVILR
jgi:hypothetical protein